MTNSQTRKEKSGKVIKTSLVVFVFILTAKILNFMKKILIGHLFGVSWLADAFFAASHFPYYIAIFFEGIIFLVILPHFSKLRSSEGEDAARRMAVQTFFILLTVTGVLAALMWPLAHWIVRELVPGFNADEMALTISLLRMMSLVIIFISLCSFFQALNSYFEHYAAAASSGLTDTLMMVVFLILTWKVWGIYGAAIGSVLGALTAFCLQFFFLLKRQRFFSGGMNFQIAGSRYLLIVFPLAVIWIFQQIPLLLINRFGSGMWEGTISALVIAQTLTTVPMGLVSHTVLLSVFPSLAKQAGAESKNEGRDTYFQILRGAFFILTCVGVLLAALGRPLAVLFFSGGDILPENTHRIGIALNCFGWAIFALYADLFTTQSLIAFRKIKRAILLCASRAALMYGLCYVASYFWDYRGLALSFSVAIVINFFCVFPMALRGSALYGRWRETYFYCLKLLTAASPAFALGYMANRISVKVWISWPAPVILAAMILSSLTLVFVYVLILRMLNIRETQMIFRFFRKEYQPGEIITAGPEV
ncbi:MAG: polysaccharide biosynthesis C-terminal domain-containing protein [Candidatus Omnitrophica bacterium]|nr:polysaccharide biosynthesis C-terminal domain-containing protein [Candidatus Omnitrophota bacterium]